MKTEFFTSKFVLTAALIVSVVFISFYTLFVKGAAFLKALAYDSQSIRVSEVNTCQMTSDSLETPHFSGCSSIL